jgi:hypothetical protein
MPLAIPNGAMSPAVVLIVVQLVLPCYLAYDVWRGASRTRSAWCLRAAAAAAFVGLMLVTGRWDLVGYYLRFVVPALFVAAAAAGYGRVRRLPWSGDGGIGDTTSLVTSIVSLALFAGLLGYAVRGYRPADEAVQLSSPLRGGVFFVGQGGDSPLINYHNTHPAQRYAVDLVELNGAGLRATSLYPTDVDRYAIYGRQVHSPCEGTVAAAIDGFVDNAPPQRDRENPAGNHVIVACKDIRVLLAHLQRGSVAVRAGATVAAGDVVGRVGNSGNTTEPHLHVHAVRDGGGRSGPETPVPILLDGTFAVRNTVLRPPPTPAQVSGAES